VIKRKVKIPYDRYTTSTPVCQLTTPTLKISITIAEVSDAGKGPTSSLAIGRESVPADGPGYRRTKGESEELNILVELE
jgi:hypothetical protein